MQFSCDTATRGKKIQVIPAAVLLLCLLLLAQINTSQQVQHQHRASPGKLEFQLVGQAGEQAQLPCLVGRQVFCGEPYFIVWYKSNASSVAGKPSWSRLEHKSEPLEPTGNELVGTEEQRNNNNNHINSDRLRFVWSRQSACELALQSVEQPELRQGAGNFDCARLTINALELADEGAYKCDVTYTESLDYDKCPASSESQLSVIARPNEPELVVNGRLLAGTRQQPMTTTANSPAFKEGAQVRLECQSAGGRPAPRIEWLNVSLPLPVGGDSGQSGNGSAVRAADVQLLRALWPHKKTAAGGELPLTSSSVTIQLSRYDLQSHFVCLLLPQQHFPSQKAAELAQLHQQQLIRSASYLADLLNQAVAPGVSGQQPAGQLTKWLKLNVQVKPSGASVRVLELESGRELEESSPSNFLPPSEPFYSLKPNKLYAVQCIVDNSRPKSLVSWFNRTAPIQVEQIELNSTSRLVQGPQTEADYPEAGQVRALAGSGRLASFTRTHANENGTFRTVASLLITSNIWDNLEELFCRVSNEAFQFDELMQVAPIMPVRLYVNYAPFAWLELAAPAQAQTGQAQPDKWSPDRSRQQPEVVRLEAGAELQLRCSIAANPLAQNAILQIDWFKDAKRLASSNSSGQPSSREANLSGGRRIYIEKTNHLHMPLQFQQPDQNLHQAAKPKQAQLSLAANQLVAGSKLMAASLLTIKLTQTADSGAYSCQFKLIPTPGGAGSGSSQQPQQQQRILSGQANNAIRLEVVEAKARAPVIRLLAQSAGLLAYWPGPQTPSDGAGSNHLGPGQPATIVGPANSQISLSCELANNRNSRPQSHKVTWYLEGQFLQSSSPLEALNVTLGAGGPATSGGALSCAHHVLGGGAPENSMRVYHSAEDLNLRLLVEPRLLADRKELMPAARSFSRLELEANPGRKLRLTCLARCEPLCSLEWRLGTEPPGADTGPRALSASLQQREHYQLAGGSNRSSGVLFEKSLASDRLLGNLIHWANLIRLQNGSAFGWLAQSKLQPAAAATGSGAPANASQQLALELAEFGGQANVVSRLELSYNQISQILLGRQFEELSLECRLTALNNSLLWRPLEPGRWTSLAELAERASGYEPDRKWPAGNNQQQQQRTKILLDKPPRNVAISFGNVVSTDERPSSVALSEGQLLELSDPSSEKVSPKLQCQLTGPQAHPAAHFKWFFTDLNQTVHPLAGQQQQLEPKAEAEADAEPDNSLNLRRFIEFRQRQLNVAPMGAYGVEVVASIVGNYTCTAWNTYGARSASLALQIQGRPLCKLSLGREFLSAQNELMASLRCSVYSQPGLSELIWFRNNQQLLVNKTSQENNNNTTLVSIGELPVTILNKEQNFMLNDLVNEPGANFKCVARNQLGYSEACELSPSDKQILTNIARPIGAGRGPAMFPMQATGGELSLNPNQNQLRPALLNNNSLELAGSGQPAGVASLFRLLASRLDWLAALATSLALVWLLFLFASKRTKYSPQRKLTSLSRGAANHETSWRFAGNTMDAAGGGGGKLKRQQPLGAAASGGTLVQLPFHHSSSQSRKLCAGNYYGNFATANGADSEVDMVQSCSQSSHYDDFVQHQLQQRLAASDRAGLYGHATLNNNRQPSTTRLKSSSMSASSSTGGDSSIGSGSRQHQLIRLNEGPPGYGQRGNARDFPGTMLHHHQQQPVAARQQQLAGSHYAQALGVPLINGTGSHNSRINLEQQSRFCGRPESQQQPAAAAAPGLIQSRSLLSGEPIYDDVIYNQMIL